MKNKILTFLVLACVLATSFVVPAFADCSHSNTVWRGSGNDGHREYCKSCSTYITSYLAHEEVFVLHDSDASRDYLWCVMCNEGWLSSTCTCAGSQSTCTHGSYTLYEHYDSVGVSSGTGITGAADYIRCKTCSRDVLIPCVCDGSGGTTEPPETDEPETDEPDEPVTPPTDLVQGSPCPYCGSTDTSYEFDFEARYLYCYGCSTTLQTTPHEYTWIYDTTAKTHSQICSTCQYSNDTHVAESDDGNIIRPCAPNVKGIKRYTCLTCDNVLYDEEFIDDDYYLDECDHPNKYMKYDNDLHWLYCAACKKVLSDKTEHVFDKFGVIEEATATTPGTYRSICSTCWYYEDTEIPPIDLDKLVENLTKEQRLQLFKNIFELYSTELITDKDILKPYVAEFVRTIYTDIAKNGSKSLYYTDYQELYYAILAVSPSNSSDYTQGYNDALSSVINDNPVQGLFQGMWSGVVHFVSVIGNGIGIGGISLMSALSTALILLVVFFLIKVLRGG